MLKTHFLENGMMLNSKTIFIDTGYLLTNRNRDVLWVLWVSKSTYFFSWLGIALKVALEKLGYNPYHMSVAIRSRHLRYWEEALRAKYLGERQPFSKSDFDKFLANYDVGLCSHRLPKVYFCVVRFWKTFPVSFLLTSFLKCILMPKLYLQTGT